MAIWGGNLGGVVRHGKSSVLRCSRDYALRGQNKLYVSDRADIATERKHAIKAANELMYGDEVIERLRNAETSSDLTRILLNARIDSCSAVC